PCSLIQAVAFVSGRCQFSLPCPPPASPRPTARLSIGRPPSLSLLSASTQIGPRGAQRLEIFTYVAGSEMMPKLNIRQRCDSALNMRLRRSISLIFIVNWAVTVMERAYSGVPLHLRQRTPASATGLGLL